MSLKNSAFSHRQTQGI